MAFEWHRDKAGEISRRYGNILVGTFRQMPLFAPYNNEKLSDVLPKLDEASFTQILHDHKAESWNAA